MKKILFFAVSAALWGQTLPTLPAIFTVNGTTVNCTFEALDNNAVSVECVATDGTMQSRAILEQSDRGGLGGHGEILALAWKDATGKTRLQVANENKLAFDGYVPTVTAKRRWRFWR